MAKTQNINWGIDSNINKCMYIMVFNLYWCLVHAKNLALLYMQWSIANSKRAASDDYHYLLHHTQDEKANEYELQLLILLRCKFQTINTFSVGWVALPYLVRSCKSCDKVMLF